MLNEYVLASTTFLMVEFAKKEKPEVDYEYGWVLLILLGVLLFVGISVITFHSFLSIRLIARKYLNRISHFCCGKDDKNEKKNLKKIKKDYDYFKSNTIQVQGSLSYRIKDLPEQEEVS